MGYKIKEIYYTIQGEGYHTGRPAIFCRFSGCNLWSGLEKDRDKAICKFCDTDFWGMDGKNGGNFSKEELTDMILSLWPKDINLPVFLVCTGGEPGLQMDEPLVTYLHKKKVEIAIETNGTVELPTGLDWVCVSPKADADILVTKGNELKLVYPQSENQPGDFEHLSFDYFFLQPLDDENQMENIKACVTYCMQNPRWNLSLQTHKFIGID
ncbi:MAG: 7-carboxy-7-deazaguanine synthase [Saprospiraceae bacterium]|nr:7-carboxy-7-deazaguanine synthase [Saprospiraceae bacterium]MBK8855375.1 7-carboxy-7-deazaguanine synthase [Saprospiraceae bacterium]MBK9043761.1 7-carboxy-7-deazaguanine synthase [Saprospiraceae bacterium]MBP6693545.1 7-carboxy-7-deazaguanine synthase [Saprospiraceae bacterium]